MENSESSEDQEENNQKVYKCQICKKEFLAKKMFHGSLIRNSILEGIKKKYPDWDSSQYICVSDLDKCRADHVENILKEEQGALSRLDNEVIQSYRDHDLLTEDINQQVNADQSLGEKLADKVAAFGGSWPFIFLFCIVLFFWIGINLATWSIKPFDPYPFILLNLVLSCLAAIQAPIIMMSQNRQAKKEKIKSEHEYMINLKAELEIQHINSKMDQLMRDQWNRMLEIQNIQIELMAEIKQSFKK